MSTRHPHDITDARALLAANVGTPVRLDLPLLAQRVAAESDGTKLKLRLFSDARGDEREELGVGWVFAREWYPGAAGTRYSHYFLSLVRAFEGLERAGREPTLRLQLLQAVRAQAPRGLQTVLLKFIIAPEYALTGTMLETVYGCPLASLYTTFVGVTFDPKRDRKPPDWTRGNAIHAGYRRAAETFARDRRPESTRAAYYEWVRA